jgi:hypothetical protein
MQKLVTICLSGYNLKHGAVEEYLADDLAHGWRVRSVAAAGGSSHANTGVVWVVVVLEREDAEPGAAADGGAR